MSACLDLKSKSLTIVGVFFAVVFWQLASGFFLILKTFNLKLSTAGYTSTLLSNRERNFILHNSIA